MKKNDNFVFFPKEGKKKPKQWFDSVVARDVGMMISLGPHLTPYQTVHTLDIKYYLQKYGEITFRKRYFLDKINFRFLRISMMVLERNDVYSKHKQCNTYLILLYSENWT